MTREGIFGCYITLLRDPKSAESTKEESGVRSDDRSVNRTPLPLRAICVETGLALADIAGLGEATGPGVIGHGVENDGVILKRLTILKEGFD